MSEVARLIEQINAECQAARLALHGYAETGKHEFITTKMENMGRLHETLKDMIGEEQAVEALVRAMER